MILDNKDTTFQSFYAFDSIFFFSFAGMKTALTRIGIDAKRIVTNRSGLGNYGRNLVNDLLSLDSPYTFQLYAPTPGDLSLRQQIEPSPKMTYCFSGRHTRLGQDLWRRSGIVKQLSRNDVQLFHGLSGELPKGLQASGIHGLMTVHDLIFMVHREYYSRIDAFLYERKFYRSLKEADRIVAISECTKRDILKYSDYPANRIDVIYQSCSTAFQRRCTPEELTDVKRRYDLPDLYILNVGTIEERKNIELVIKALSLLPSNIHLIIVGRQTRYADKVKSMASHLGVIKRIRLLEGVPNQDLPAIYQQAATFVYPSRYEGFGIPIIEAIQSGLTVTAATGSCLEEAGGPFNSYVNPDDPDAMAKSIQLAINPDNDNKTIVAQSQEYIKRFENACIGKSMLAEYTKILQDNYL